MDGDFRNKPAMEVKNAKNRKTALLCGKKPAFLKFSAHK
jgi:hypothetical protein